MGKLMALVIDGQIVEKRTIDPEKIPAHKRKWWFDWIEEVPAHLTVTHIITGHDVVIEPEKGCVRNVSRIAPRPAEFVKMRINEEAQRRIVERYPLWKQTNIVRRGSPEALSEMSAFIDKIVAASNRLTAATSAVPADYTDDKYWKIG